MALEIKYDLGAFTPRASTPDLGGADLQLGLDEEGRAVSLSIDQLHSGRLLVQAPSGAGKTTLLRHLISQCAFSLTWVVLDPEGEYKSLWRWNDMYNSGVADLSDYSRERQLIYLSEFVKRMMDRHSSLWNHRIMVILDEVEIYTPTDCSAFDDPSVGKRSKSALVELMSRGRKRGLISVLATHRLSQLAASVRAEARNLLIGGSSFDVDIHRAAEAIGWTRSKATEILPKLPVGTFIGVGQAFNRSPVLVRIPKP